MLVHVHPTAEHASSVVCDEQTGGTPLHDLQLAPHASTFAPASPEELPPDAPELPRPRPPLLLLLPPSPASSDSGSAKLDPAPLLAEHPATKATTVSAAATP
jgi:hypothetical protein